MYSQLIVWCISFGILAQKQFEVENNFHLKFWRSCSIAHFFNMLKYEFVRAQDRLPGNISQWHIDYSELKVLDKQLLPEGHLDPPLSLWMQEINLPCDRCPPYTWKTPFIAKQLGAKACCLFSNSLLRLNSSLMNTQALLIVLPMSTNLFSHLFHPFFTNVLFPLSTKYKKIPGWLLSLIWWSKHHIVILPCIHITFLLT